MYFLIFKSVLFIFAIIQYYQGGESVCRNKSLQTMFSMIGVAEKAGSGTDKIIRGWKESNWRSPKIEETLNPDKVVLEMPMESLMSEKTKTILSNHFGIAANAFDYNVMQVLALVCEEGFVTNQRLRYSLSMYKSEIADLLKKMCQNGLLEAKGHGRGMKYVLGEKNVDLFMRSTSCNSASSDANSASSGTNSACSDANSASSDANSASSVKKRMKKEELYDSIKNICQDWVSLEEIVRKAEKSNSYLRNYVIPKMLADEILEMLYPGTPKHPCQKYKVKE